MIARFYYSDGSYASISEFQSVLGLTRHIGERIERPIRVEFIDNALDLKRKDWQRDCESAISNLKSEISDTPIFCNCPRCGQAMERTGDHHCMRCGIVFGFRAGGAA